jgi:tRNA(Ile)-lysidine synthase
MGEIQTANDDPTDRGPGEDHGDVERQLMLDWPPTHWCDVTTVVAVSGGGDSLALLRALRRVRAAGAGRLVAAHFNHQLRSSAAADADFVREVCRDWGIEVHVGRDNAPPPTVEPGGGGNATTRVASEAAARQRRYAFLRSVVHQTGARFLVTAHTSDDQVETILHRILRGTGLPGLQGIPRLRQLTPHCTLIRPLLGVSRDQLRQYLRHASQPYRDDPTNGDLNYTRNRIRRELLPSLARDYNQNVADALLRLGRLAGDAERALQGTVDELYQQSVVESPGAARIACPPLARSDGYLVRRVFMQIWQRQEWPRQAMTMRHWDQLAELVSSRAAQGEASKMLPGAVRISRQGDQLLLVRL